MSKTYKEFYHKKLFSNGNRNHHNTLMKEFYGLEGCGMVKDVRGLLDRRDYKSDRNKGIRKIMNQKRRTSIKRMTDRIVQDETID